MAFFRQLSANFFHIGFQVFQLQSTDAKVAEHTNADEWGMLSALVTFVCTPLHYWKSQDREMTIHLCSDCDVHIVIRECPLVSELASLISFTHDPPYWPCSLSDSSLSALLRDCRREHCIAGVLLVAGGIGVTPIRAMLAVCIQRGYPVTLIYSVRQAGDAAFLSEFKEVPDPSTLPQLALDIILKRCLLL